MHGYGVSFKETETIIAKTTAMVEALCYLSIFHCLDTTFCETLQ